jgi:hypothetical protein
VKVTASTTLTHNPCGEAYWASGLRENLTSRSYGEGLETGRVLIQAPRQSFTRQTYYDRLKNIFEVERFSGRSVLSIEQDFYGVIFLATLESVLSKEAEAELAQASAAAQCKYEARLNRTVSYLALVDHTVALLLDPHRTIEETLATLHHLFKTNPTRYRPGRQFPRQVRSHARQLWFLRYARRLIA